LEGTDWHAVNYDDKTRAGLDRPNYDGINVYGDEVATNIRNVSDGLAAGRIAFQYNVFRSILPKFNSK
jgi:hypothetical protein